MQNNRFYLLVFALNFFVLKGFTQQVGINTDGSLPNPNAILDVKSFNKGVLLPRVSTSGRLAIPNTTGLLVYDTTTRSFWYNTGTSWKNMVPGSGTGTGWLLNGNSGTSESNFIGTTDFQPLIIKVNNEPAGRLDLFTGNSYWGLGSGAASTPGILGVENTGIGYNTLTVTTDGSYNTASGSQALAANTSGSYNTATGIGSLYANINGSFNTSNGSYSLEQNTTGNDNTAAGIRSLQFNTTGFYNTSTGSTSMHFNTTGSYNTAMGYLSLDANTTGNFQTAVGSLSLQTNGIGFGNTAIGAEADVSFSALNNATAIGYTAIVNASNKVRIGNSAVTRIEGAVPFSTPSDGRFKYDVQEDVKGLDFIMQLRPVSYHFDVKRFDEQLRGAQKGAASAGKDNVMSAAYAGAAAIRRSGFIAQEVEKAAAATKYDFSGIIKPDSETGHYSLSYESFIPSLVKGLQELNKKIETLQKENASLKEELRLLIYSK
jgi:trimeric autotransporter adhesin